MRFKRVVSISMIVSGIFLTLILIIGLTVPASALDKIGRKRTVNQTTKTVDGKTVTETVNPATGDTVVTTTDPTTGASTTTTVQPTTNNSGTTPAPTPTTPTPGGGGGGTTPAPTTPPPSGGGTPAVIKPVTTISVSPTTITSGSSATLGWSATNTPTSCTASGGWSGSKASSGTLSVSPTSTTTYTLACTNSAGVDTKSATLTVNVPAPTCGQPGSTCHLSDIQGHNTAGDCRSAINASGAGLAAYAISSAFLSSHQPKKPITSSLCGKVYSSNLSSFTSDHRNGQTLSGSNYGTWINNFYLAPYN